MKQLLILLSLSLPLLLTGCGYDEFEGRFIGPEGNISYEFQTNGTVEFIRGEDINTAEYEYKSNDRLIKLISEQDLPTNTLKIKEDGNLQADDMTLTRGVDYTMLDNSTWIGHQGQYTFALTFNMTDQGLETVSELVSYYDENMMYLSQTDDSITRLEGNKLLLDQTQYTVSDVSRESFKISIGENSMVLEKQPKGTAIPIREDYERIDEQL